MIRIVHFTDTHMDAGEELRARREADLANHVAVINRLDPQPDVVIFTGDMANGGKPEEYDIVRRHMDNLRAPWLAVPGNRDSRRRMRAAFANHEWGGGHAQGPLDFFVQVGPLALIGFDSKGPGTNKGWAHEERRQSLRRLLKRQQARRR